MVRPVSLERDVQWVIRYLCAGILSGLKSFFRDTLNELTHNDTIFIKRCEQYLYSEVLFAKKRLQPVKLFLAPALWFGQCHPRLQIISGGIFMAIVPGVEVLASIKHITGPKNNTDKEPTGLKICYQFQMAF